MSLAPVRNGLFIFLIIGIFSTILSGLINVEVAKAACNSPLVSIDDSCVTENCNAAGVPLGECLQVVRACENTYFLGDTTETSVGNCSNALRSCFEHAVDTRGCKDNGVLSRVSQCNNGNVNADRTSGSWSGTCGIDAAIDEYNARDDGEDFETNSGIKERRKNEAKEACRGQGTGYTTAAQITECERNAEQDAESCYGELGGTATKVTDAQYENCMINKADSESQCKIRGGTWGTSPGQAGSDTGTCTNPKGDPNDPNNPNNNEDDTPAEGPKGAGVEGSDKRCGAEARVNILECDTEGGAAALGNVLRIFIIVLTTGVGIAAVGGIAYSAIQYAGAQDNQSNLSSARERIRNIVIGLLLYGFLIAIVNWLVPGSVIQ